MSKLAVGAILIVAGIGWCTPRTTVAASWPFEEQNWAHDINKTYGQHEWGVYPGEGYRHFLHTGIDIPKDPWTKVVAVENGYVIDIKRNGNFFYRWLVLGSETTGQGYRYAHIDSRSIPPELYEEDPRPLVTEGDSLAMIVFWPGLPPIHHLHFERVEKREDEFKQIGNPFIYLNPNADSYQPVLDSIYYKTNEPEARFYTEEELEGGIHHDVDIVIQAYDFVPREPSENPEMWKAGLYAIGYEIDGPGGHDIPSRTFIEFGDEELLPHCFAPVVHDSTLNKAGDCHSYIVTNKDYETNLYHWQYCWHTKHLDGGQPWDTATCNDEAEFPDGEYRVVAYMTDYDSRKRTVGASKGAVIVDNFLPVVESTDPEDGEENADPDAFIKATFSEYMDEETTTGDVVTVVNLSNQTQVRGSLSYDASTCVLTFDPAGPLEIGVEYQVTISDAVTDLARNALDGDGNGVPGGDFSWTFRVGWLMRWLHADEEDTYMGSEGYLGVAAALEFVNTEWYGVELKAIVYNWYSWSQPLGHVWLSDGTGKPKWKDPEHWHAERDFPLGGGPGQDFQYDLEEPVWLSSGENFWVGWQIDEWFEECYSGWNYEGDPPYWSWWWNTGYWYKCDQQPGYPNDGDWTMEVLVEPPH